MSEDSYFVDTNVLLYAIDSRSEGKRTQASEWLDYVWRSDSGRLSWQVLNEFYANATSKVGLPPSEARRRASLYIPWNPGGMSPYLMQRAWHWADTAQVTHWDGLILASAERQGCRWLLSEDFQAGRTYGDVLIVNPFEAGPPAHGPAVRH